MKKSLTAILTVAMLVSLAGDVSAYSFGQVNEKYGTKGVLEVKGDGSTDANFNPLADVTMRSVGTSKFTYDKRGTGYTSKMSAHTITVDVGAVGFPSLEISAAGVNADLVSIKDRNTAVIKSGGVRDWDYSINTTYGRMISYMQTHNFNYSLYKGNKKHATINLSGYWKWGI